MKISVFGVGYVGLVTGACLADAGHEVMCMDIDPDKIARLQKGEVPIYEPGLDDVVTRNVAAGRLFFTTEPAKAVEFGVLQFIAVGTPPDEDGSADLQYVLNVARLVGEHMTRYKVLIDKSTVPVGTADKVRDAVAGVLAERFPSEADRPEFDVCSNPEFLKEGAAIDDFSKGARIVVGTGSERVRELMSECYAPYNRIRNKLMFMDVRAAELTKYAANSMLATKISYMNEIANLAERLDVDIEQVRQGIGSDPRIGYHFIYPGCGYGGSCFPKDVQALTRTASEVGYDAELLKAVEAVNLRQKQTLFSKLSNALDGDLKGRTVAVWGLSFKPETDDMRDAPSRVLMEALWNAGATVRGYDPVAENECRRIYGQRDDLQLVEDRMEALQGADALVICTEWTEFRSVDFAAVKAALRFPVIVDGRNVFEPKAVKEAGLMYYGVGRADSLQGH